MWLNTLPHLDYSVKLPLEGEGFRPISLVIFDRRSHQPPIEERTTTERATTSKGRTVTVIRA
jgi:hypothetical protein